MSFNTLSCTYIVKGCVQTVAAARMCAIQAVGLQSLLTVDTMLAACWSNLDQSLCRPSELLVWSCTERALKQLVTESLIQPSTKAHNVPGSTAECTDIETPRKGWIDLIFAAAKKINAGAFLHWQADTAFDSLILIHSAQKIGVTREVASLLNIEALFSYKTCLLWKINLLYQHLSIRS